MKLNLIAISSLIAAGAMISGDANAQQRTMGHMQEVRSVLAAERAARGDVEIQAIGDLDTGYNPIEPCRVADTRSAVAGRLAAGETRGFVIDGSDLSFQGGEAAGCTIPDDVSSVSINVTVVLPTGAGFLTAFPGGTPQPETSTVNYTAGSIVGNGSLIAVGDGLDVFTFDSTDVVIDVTGYFATQAATELDCYTSLNDPVLVEAGLIFTEFAFCEPGYAAVGGACDQADEMPLLGAGTFSDEGAHVCVFDNTGRPDGTAYIDAGCCRIQPQTVVVE